MPSEIFQTACLLLNMAVITPNFDDLYFQQAKGFIYLHKLKSYQPKWNTERSKYIRFRLHEKYTKN